MTAYSGYFDHNEVTELVKQYQARGCTSVALRDNVMLHSNELISGIIKSQNLKFVAHIQDHTTEYELHNIAWVQIERSLYKINTEGTKKIFSMWTMIAKTSMLAYIKKNKRDRKDY
jgi:hypothetical protein